MRFNSKYKEIMQLIPFILFIIGLDLLAFQAFATVSEEWTLLSKTLLYSIYWFIPLAAFIYGFQNVRGNAQRWTKAKHSLLRSVFSLAYLGKFIIIFALFLFGIKDMLVGIFYSLTNNPNSVESSALWTNQIAILCGVIPFVVMIYGIVRNPYRYKIFKEIVSIKGLPKKLEGLKIVQISDIHSGSFTKKEPVRNAINLINQQNADLVFFTGDLVNSIASEMDNFIDVFDKIRSKYGTLTLSP